MVLALKPKDLPSGLHSVGMTVDNPPSDNELLTQKHNANTQAEYENSYETRRKHNSSNGRRGGDDSSCESDKKEMRTETERKKEIRKNEGRKGRKKEYK